MKILITGIAGLIGTHFSKYLLDKGYDIIGIDNLSGGYIENIDQRLITNKFFQIDLINGEDINKIFNLHKPDVVFHFAAYAAEGLSPFIRKYNYENNVICSINVINECIRYNVKKLIFTSSMAVYGYGNPPFSENQLLSPIDPYGIAKYTVEQDIKQAYEQFGLNYTIIRPHNIIGIYQNIWDIYRNVIGIWIRRILDNHSIIIYGDGLQQRAFSNIKFYMEPLEKIINDFNTETFNIGADKYFSILDVAQILQTITKKYNYECKIQHQEPRHEVKHAYCDHTKAKTVLEFKDETNLEDLIESVFVWAMSQPNRKVKRMDYEVTKNIYDYWRN